MDNEATKVLNEQQNQNEVNETTTQQTAEKKGDGKGARVAGVAAGAAMGAGVAMGAERAYEAFTNDEADEPEVKLEAAAPAPKAAPAEAEVEQKPEEAPKSEEKVKPEESAPEVTQDSHHDETAGGDGNAQKTATSVDADDEVHVVGVGVQDNGNGGVATVVAVQKGDDHALLVDVESDGRLDYAIHDDNGNGEIEDHEVHDVGNENISTVNVVGAYVAEARAQGVTPVVTDMETGQSHEIDTTPDGGLQITGADEVVPDDNYVDASDDMGDYMDTTDPGLMDV
ncbi:MAG: hypothetical protein MSA44_10490 [Bacteroidales bacterium]|nr:hypothetical protein [Bacteroidales bacterium]